MRRLHVIGVSADGAKLLLATGANSAATHAVAIDDRLTRTLRGERPDGAPVEALLSPKEIQARLRAGATLEAVAADAGVPLARVERYAGPVLSEREQVLSGVLRAHVHRPRTGRSALPLGVAVDANVAATGYARPETSEWTAYRRADGRWIARFEVVIRARRRRAEWVYDVGSHEVTGLDSYATALGYADSAPRPSRLPSSAQPVVVKPVVKKASARGPSGPKAATKTAANRAPAKKARAKKAPAKKAPAKKAPVKKAPAKTAPTNAPTPKARAKAAAATSTPVTSVRAKRAPATSMPPKKSPTQKTTTLSPGRRT